MRSKNRLMSWIKNPLVFLLVVFGCGAVAFLAIPVGIALLLSTYDPEAEAIAAFDVYLTEPDVIFWPYDLIFDQPCWDAIQQAATETNYQYDVDMLYSSWENPTPLTRGEETTLQVTFANGASFRVYLYQGNLQYCEVEAE